MMWVAIIGTAIAISIPMIIMWGFWQLEKMGIEDIEWRDDE